MLGNVNDLFFIVSMDSTFLKYKYISYTSIMKYICMCIIKFLKHCLYRYGSHI